MLPSCTDLPQKSLQIKTNDKFFSRRLTSEISIENFSSEFYHGKTSVAAIPFMWESQPGTPKHKFCEDPLPPLTPPPSYFSNATRKPIKKPSKHKLIHNVIPKLTPRKIHTPQSPASTSSSSSGSWSYLQSVSSSPNNASSYQRRVGMSNPRFSFDSRVDVEGREYEKSPVSTLCFGAATGTHARSRGCYSALIKLLL